MPRIQLFRTKACPAIVEVVPGQVWLGTLGQGIVAVDVASSQTRRIRRDLTQPASLADDSIQGMFKDRSGLIWICSDRSISRHDPSHPGRDHGVWCLQPS